MDYIKKIVFIILFITILIPNFVFAQNNAITFSITPPLIKNNLKPGDVWGSAVKIVNNNPETKEFFTEVYNFKSTNNGQGIEFIDFGIKDEEKSFLSAWIDFDEGAIEVPAYGSKEIPFIIKVPENANPGGHYAAILVGTKPEEKKGGSVINISSKISTLLLINIAGDIIEKGKIREFSVDKNIYNKPDVKMNVKFENLGNVHLQPVGEIVIFDMYGNEKTSLPINHNTQFGNVLPESSRSWNFEWKGEEGIFNMGRYRAELRLAFGNSVNMSDVYSLNFWILDFRILGIVFGSILFLIILVVILVKLSIKRAIKNVQIQANIENENINSSRSVHKNSNFKARIKQDVKKNNIKPDNSVVDLRKK